MRARLCIACECMCLRGGGRGDSGNGDGKPFLLWWIASFSKAHILDLISVYMEWCESGRELASQFVAFSVNMRANSGAEKGIDSFVLLCDDFAVYVKTFQKCYYCMNHGYYYGPIKAIVIWKIMDDFLANHTHTHAHYMYMYIISKRSRSLSPTTPYSLIGYELPIRIVSHTPSQPHSLFHSFHSYGFRSNKRLCATSNRKCYGID